MNVDIKNEFINAFKSKKYLFTIILVFVSIIVTSKYVFDKYGSMDIASVGVVEFFIVSVLLGNNILQICAPIIPIFSTLDISGVYSTVSNNVLSTKRNVCIRIILTTVVASSIYIFTYAITILFGLVIFGISGETFYSLSGPLNHIYYSQPFSYILFCTCYACFFNISYSLLGMGIGLNLNKHKTLCIYIPLVFYNCFKGITSLMPYKMQNFIKWISPNYTFDVALIDKTLYERIIEIGFVLVCGLLLIYVAYRRKKKII